MPCPEVDFDDVQESDIPTSTGLDIRCAEVEKTDPNYNNINQTDFIYTNQSINPPAPSTGAMEVDRYEVREEVKESLIKEHESQINSHN